MTYKQTEKNKIRMIGVGDLGAAVADQLQEYPEYRTYKVVAEANQNNTFSLGSYDSMQEYETNFPERELGLYLDSLEHSQQVLIVAEGGSPITGCLLRLMELLRHCQITLLYIKPSSSLRSLRTLQNTRLSFGALQEYARSGMLERMIFIDRALVEDMVGDVPINLYDQRVVEIISYTLGMLYYFENTEPIVTTLSERPVGCRLATLGISSITEDPPTMSLLYDLESPRLSEFFYGIPEEEISTNSSLMRQINYHRDFVCSPYPQDFSFSYAVVPVIHENSYLLGLFYTTNPEALNLQT